MSEHILTIDLRKPLPERILDLARSQLQSDAASRPRVSRRVLRKCAGCGAEMSSREFRAHPARCPARA